MLATRLQLSKYTRKHKVRRNKVSAFFGAPMKRGFIYKVTTMPPRKPNSAKRTFAKVWIKDKRIFAKIPGLGAHGLQNHSVVLVRGHGPKDSPGINYHLIRGVYDFIRVEEYGRKNRRSKFGLKQKIKY